MAEPSAAGDRDSHPLLVFDHIPKTAGTTFRRSYLIAALPRDQRWIVSGGDANSEDLERFLTLSPARRRRIRIVAGHNAESLRAYLPDARFLTIVRDPVDRAVSAYLHALFHPGGEALWPDVRENQMGLRDFVLKYQPPNLQSAQLLGAGNFDEPDIRESLRARYALVGYTEAFDQFVFLLHVFEGLPVCLYSNRLARKERETYAPPADDLAFVRELNAQDLLLHQVVRAEFDRKVRELAPHAHATMTQYLDELARFRAATAGDLTRSVRLDEAALDGEAARSFEVVFGRRPAAPTGAAAVDRSILKK